ncbi:hypothetical protein CWR48_13430 [Oceanobacillus arenosus]|uniref:C4-dicarboxylate ABC transporter substrate-binding protein n=1 Tax=Oceanobacillus arenosus TaxID=1229153 RepID=A0A3D8PPD6_9BACI|nr:TAXI family TRAP transporter solute-binding subunit [Oceanobacillus arenosus]RDW17522.1 hypothetical protein CWR48_13430 [Oceanobacillus arenosus]
MTKKFKRFLSVLFIVGIALVIAACGSSSTSSEGESGKSSGGNGEQIFVSIGTSSASGTFHIIGGALADIWTEELENVTATARTAPGSSAENVPMLQEQQIEVATLTSEQAHFGYRGGELYDERFEGLRAISGGHIGELQIIANADNGIESIADLEGKRIGKGAPGSTSESMAYLVMEAYGIEDWTPVDGSNADDFNNLRDGNVDAVFSPLGAPTPGIMELDAVMNLNFLPIDDDKAEAIVKDRPYFFKATVDAGAYNSLEEDYNTIAYGTVIATSADMDEDLIYDLSKLLYESTDRLAGIHAQGSFYSLENATTGVTIPYHKGAAKYLEEQGIEVESE